MCPKKNVPEFGADCAAISLNYLDLVVLMSATHVYKFLRNAKVVPNVIDGPDTRPDNGTK